MPARESHQILTRPRFAGSEFVFEGIHREQKRVIMLVDLPVQEAERPFCAIGARHDIGSSDRRNPSGTERRLHVDRYLVDGLLNVLSALTLRGGARLRGIQSGRAQDYVYGVAFGVLLLIVWAQLWR